MDVRAHVYVYMSHASCPNTPTHINIHMHVQPYGCLTYHVDKP